MGVKWLENLSQLMDAILLLAPIINRRNVAGLDWVSVPEPHYTASPSSVLRHLPGCSTYRSGIFGESQYCFSYLISVRSYNYYDGYPILVQLVWEWSGDEAMVCAALTGSGWDIIIYRRGRRGEMLVMWSFHSNERAQSADLSCFFHSSSGKLMKLDQSCCVCLAACVENDRGAWVRTRLGVVWGASQPVPDLWGGAHFMTWDPHKVH